MDTIDDSSLTRIIQMVTKLCFLHQGHLKKPMTEVSQYATLRSQGRAIMSNQDNLGFFDLTVCYEGLSQKGDSPEQLAVRVPWETFGLTLLKGASPLRNEERAGGALLIPR